MEEFITACPRNCYRLGSSVYRMYVNNMNSPNSGIRFLRIAFLLISGVSLVTKISYNDPVIICLFLTGELIDRFLFYSDFVPLNINTLITKHIKVTGNETKGC